MVTSNELTIRRAVLADADEMARCIDAAYARYYGRISDLPPVSEGCDEEITTNQVWLAQKDSAIIGVLVLVKRDGFLKLANLAVDPAHGGQGIGHMLVNLAKDEARRQGYKELHLSTHVEMPDNIALYQHLGWVETGRQGNTVSMCKRITD